MVQTTNIIYKDIEYPKNTPLPQQVLKRTNNYVKALQYYT